MLFFDVFFNSNKKFGGLGYTEISKNIALGKFPIQSHIEFNGGLYIDKPSSNENYSDGIHNAFLAGLSYPILFKNDVYFETQVLYKMFTDYYNKPNVQLTFVWGIPMCDNKLNFAGFFDVWSEEKALTFRDNLPYKKQVVVYTEPQLWYNVTNNFSIGSEVRIGYNFVFNSTLWEIYPCLGLKYNFK